MHMTIRQRPNNLLYLAGSLAFIILGINTGVFLLIHDPQIRTNFSDIFSPIVDILVCIALLFGAKVSTARSRRLALGWGTIALAMLFYALGDISWAILEVGFKLAPFPSIADVLYLAFYPVFLVGVFILVDRPASIGERINKSLDIFIILLAATLFFWNFLIGPLIQANAGEPLSIRAILLAYPVGDLVVLGALLLIIYSGSGGQSEIPVFLLAGSLLVLIVTDSIYSYQSMLGTYVSGNYLDLGWIISFLLAGLAGVSQFAAARSVNITGEIAPRNIILDRIKWIRPYLPYFWLVAAFVLLIMGGLKPLPMSFLSLSIAVGGIIGLVLVRQFITITENFELRFEISERKKAEAELIKSEEHYRQLFESNPLPMWLYDLETLRFVDVNEAAIAHYGYSQEEFLAMTIRDIRPPEELSRLNDSLAEPRQSREQSGLRKHRKKDGSVIDVEFISYNTLFFNRPARLVLASDITERKHAEDQLRYQAALLANVNDAIVAFDNQFRITAWNVAAESLFGWKAEQVLGQNALSIVLTEWPVTEVDEMRRAIAKTGVWRGEATQARKDGTRFPAEVSSVVLKDESGQATTYINVNRDITERKRAEEEIRSRADEISAQYELSRELALADDLDKVLRVINHRAVESIHTTFARVALVEGSNFVIRGVYPIRALDHDLGIGDRQPITAMPRCKRVLEQNELVILHGHDPEIEGRERAALMLDFAQSVCLVPLRVGDSAQSPILNLGMLMLGEVRKEGREPFTPEKMRLARSIGDQAAVAIRRILLREQTVLRMQHLTALGEIDRTIVSNFDLRTSLEMLLNQVIAQLGVDAADVLLLNTNTLEFAAGRGFHSKAIEHSRVRLGEGQAGKVALERRVVQIPDIAASGAAFAQVKLFTEERVAAYFAVPLIAKGQVKGVLEIFQRAPFQPDEEWLDFLNTLAGQAAIAIDNATLFESLQRSNTDLSLAYDATIEGWSRALDLRDKETEGHTQRVMEISVKLSRESGLSEADLVQVRWGALLHDIGKMGVPDAILLKPGPLTDEEWKVMRMHPQFAYDMLAPIAYLRSAIDIPYCHHEKWDGTGYPRGLKGDLIPLTARIFAVVDVWDALRSDRPYRKGWSDEKAREHIRSLAGTHFDPKAVEVFLKVMNENA
jgi:PAS domain S-box-containing protein